MEGMKNGFFADLPWNRIRSVPVPQNLNPGDKVVELAALAILAAITTGAVEGGWIGWIVKKNWIYSTGSLAVGAMVGFATGQLFARLLYRASGYTKVVKIGGASLSSTIPAALISSIATAVIIVILGVTIFGARDQALTLMKSAIGLSIGIGVVMSCLGSLI